MKPLHLWVRKFLFYHKIIDFALILGVFFAHKTGLGEQKCGI